MDRPLPRPSRTFRMLAGALLTGVLVTGFAVPAAPAAAAPTTIVAFGSTGWSYYRGSAEPPKSWRTATVPWKRGKAPLGFGTGTGALGTKLPNSFKTKPLATFFQRTFTLKSVPAGGVTLTTWADDGVIVYVNGTEVLRRNLPGGPITTKSYAVTAPQTAKAKASPGKATIPASVLRAGRNVIAAQVQSNWRATHNVTFDARLVAAPLPPKPPVVEQPTAPPAAPDPAPVPAPDAPQQLPPSAAAWGEPTWRDEFDYVDPGTGRPAIDPAKWNVRGRSDLGLLFDAAVPDRGQVSVDAAGIAHIRGDWLDTPTIRTAGAGPTELWHTTGYLDQRSLKSGDVSRGQRWGRWEIRAKVPTGPKTYGALAAFWLRNSQLGEIDILEAWGYNEHAAPGGQRIDTSTTTVHTNTLNVNNEKYIWHHADSGAPTPVWDDFHTYAFELLPDYAAIYVDDVRVARVTPLTHPNLWNEAYFGSPLHMRLNLHVGPSSKYWGLPDPAHRDWTQPLDFQVDHVRTWERHG
ncbi:family 16 glycosylhydrolase [Lysobacter korlensis]|uniref:Family 16 glycosylhydrolase n=1 Tax=Lysobacter korlensis TaxID=553636 RepID=A0ABV6RNK6_9GAMM